MRRELTDTERHICLKSANRIKEELKHLDYLLEYQNLMINKGLWYNYNEKLEEFKKMRESMLEDIKMSHEKLNIIQIQLDKGVEIVEKARAPGIN